MINSHRSLSLSSLDVINSLNNHRAVRLEKEYRVIKIGFFSECKLDVILFNLMNLGENFIEGRLLLIYWIFELI